METEEQSSAAVPLILDYVGQDDLEGSDTLQRRNIVVRC